MRTTNSLLELRREIFNKLDDHPLYKKLKDKLRDSDFVTIEKFLEINGNESNETFEFYLNRFFLDREKPKNWSIISELLSITNSKSKGAMK